MSGARIRRAGFLVPARNPVVEPDVYSVVPEMITAHFARLPISGPSLSDDDNTLSLVSQKMRQGAEEAAGLLKAVQVDVLAYMHTATSYVAGPETDRRFEGRLGNIVEVPATTAARSIAEALKYLGVHNICFVTPYPSRVTQLGAQYFNDSGFLVLSARGLGYRSVDEIISADIGTFEALIKDSLDPSTEAIVISGTASKAMSFAMDLEAIFALPVITSNLAVLWHCLKILGLSSTIERGEALFSRK